MLLRFPGPAEPASELLRWDAWTAVPSVVRFGGQAAPAVEPLVWQTAPSTEAIPTPEPQLAAPPQAPTAPTATPPSAPPLPNRPKLETGDWRPPRPSPHTAAPRPVPTPAALPPTELLTALGAAQDATASAHAVFLRQQQAHLDVVADAHQALMALVVARSAPR